MMQDNATSPAAVWAPPRWLYRASVAWGALLGVPLCLFTNLDTLAYEAALWRHLPAVILVATFVLGMAHWLFFDVLGMALAAAVYFRPVVRSMRVKRRPGALLWAYSVATVAMPAILATLTMPLALAGGLLLGYIDRGSAIRAVIGPVSAYLLPALLCLPPIGVLTGLVLYVRLRPERGDDGGARDGAGPESAAPSSAIEPPHRLFAATVLWGAALGALAFIYVRYPVYALLGRRGGFWTPAAIVAIGLVASGVALSFRSIFRRCDRWLLARAYPLVSTALAVALMPMTPLLWSADGYRLATGGGTVWKGGSIQSLFLRGEPALLGMIALGVVAGLAVGRLPGTWVGSDDGVGEP